MTPLATADWCRRELATCGAAGREDLRAVSCPPVLPPSLLFALF